MAMTKYSSISKHLNRTIRYLKVFESISEAPALTHFKSRYTNFSLISQWEPLRNIPKYILMKEVLLMALGKNPEIFEPDLDRFPVYYMSLIQPNNKLFSRYLGNSKKKSK
ncbi:hypothetical protein cand_001130 [Cryptosporidium andersoni]|uniref:Uncharacterized protein n=1 Tax=Cryptosporidium andersoni TaxID=117008 RepID=A0A1J4MRA3_9CRYT|nr:hypothetical protein cand_001130 [Cryptosporidium andersoni]